MDRHCLTDARSEHLSHKYQLNVVLDVLVRRLKDNSCGKKIDGVSPPFERSVLGVPLHKKWD